MMTGVLKRAARLFSVVVATVVLAACAGGPPTGSFDGPKIAVLKGQRPPSMFVSDDKISPDFRQLSGWGRDDHGQALPSFLRSCAKFETRAGGQPVGSRGIAGMSDDWARVCRAARSVPPGDAEAARKFFESAFQPLPLGGGEEGLFTGYYEPTVRGSWTKTGRYTTPLYKAPAVGKGLPDRKRIVNGALAGRGLELMWVDDPVDAFFLQIQGSGRAVMSDGSSVELAYAGQNGHPYFPIGRWLMDQGLATKEEMSMPFLRNWLGTHPGDAADLMNRNPSYVFFKRRDGVVKGAGDMELTPGRSLAVDREHVPMGPPLWIDLRDAPVDGGRVQRLVMAQDTGGAIKGEVRGDLFWGADEEAAIGAGLMKARGRAFMLVPRERSRLSASR